MYVGLLKLDAEPPKIIVNEPKANSCYVALERRVTIHIRATIRDDKAIKSIRIELWGTTTTGVFDRASGLLYGIDFDQPDTNTIHIDETKTLSIAEGFVLPGWYYVRFVVEDFIGNKRIIWIKIYIDVSNDGVSSNDYIVFCRGYLLENRKVV